MISDKHLLDHTWTAHELRKLSATDRDTVLSHATESAAHLYAADPSMTDFDAFGEQDLHGDSSDAS